MSLLNSLGIFCILLIPVFCHFDRHYPERGERLYTKLNTVSGNYSAYILPTNLKPTWYNLTLLPFLNNNTFKGWVVITFDVIDETNQIVIHGNNNSIQDKSVTASVASAVQIVSQTFSVDPVHEFFIFTLNDTLKKQSGVSISISYDGVLSNDMMGFYYSTYTSASGNHSMAITQFESTYARRAFPCFDEPAYRAQFLVKLLRSVNQSSVSNMPRNSSVTDTVTGLIEDIYNPTPLMPTYLVAFGVSDLANKSDGKNFTVYAREAVIQDASYLVTVGHDILDKIGNFVGISYPLPKMDVVAVPDFNAGAMENWGLTTYREKYVLYNPVKNSWRDKFGVLSVVAHEFGHQWFGDLVTPQWWNYTWLNEAFATYFEYTTSDQMAPDWGMGSKMFVMEAVQYALAADTGNPRPMTAPVYTPDQISDIFDYVIYEKGGSILRMAENFLTTPIWRAGLTKYLETHAYGTGTPERLFTALQDEATSAGLNNVNETLQGWTTQPGYPLVTVTQVNSTSNTTVYNITQAPYALNITSSVPSWNIPLTFTTQSQRVFDASKASRQWLYPSNTSTISVNGTGWVIFNVDQIGFYRVNYDSNNWQKLKSQLTSNFSVIGSINRAQLLDDAFHLARTGHVDYATALGLTSYLSAELEVAPWNAFFTNMNYLINQFSGTSTENGLKQYARSVMATPFKVLTGNLNKFISTFTGSLTVQYASLFSCDIGLPDCEAYAKKVFDDWRNNILGYVISPEVKQTVLCTGLRLDSTMKAFMDVLNYYLNSNNGAEKLAVMNAMGCATGGDVINVYLNVVCDETNNYVRLQDRYIAFRSLASHQSGITSVLQYLANNFDKVNNALGPRISSVISTLGHTIIQQNHVNQVQSIVNDAKIDQRLRSMLNSTVLPAVAKRQAWVSSPQATTLKSWVDSYVKSSGSSIANNVFLVVVAVIVIFSQ